MSQRNEILTTANDLTHYARDAIYGDPLVGMRCAAELKAVYRRYAGARTIEHDEAIERVFEKLGRIATGAYQRDNYVDGAAYFGIAGECEERNVSAYLEALAANSPPTPEEAEKIREQMQQGGAA